MNNEIKFFMVILSVFLLILTVSMVSAADNCTSDSDVEDALELCDYGSVDLDDCDVLYEDSSKYGDIELRNNNSIVISDDDYSKTILERLAVSDELNIDDNLGANFNELGYKSGNDDLLEKYVSYKGTVIVNPSFENGMTGWNVSGDVYASDGGYRSNGIYSGMIFGLGNLSQIINFNVIDSFSFYAFFYSGVPFLMLLDDEVLFESPTNYNFYNGWCKFEIDASNISGWHEIKLVSNRTEWTAFDDFKVVKNDVIDPYFSVKNIDVVGDGISVDFCDDSFGYISSWFWDFGDGVTSEEEYPTHVYKNPGLYNVSLVISDGSKFEEVNKTINVMDIFDVDFSNDVSVGYESLLVNFTDCSSGDILEWFWDFGDGSVSSERNPVHNYGVGNYNVTLVVCNEVKSLSVVKSGLIHVSGDLVADFVSNNQENFYSHCVNFTDCSGGNPTGYLWDFGDGNVSTDKNPVHVYGGLGDYNVSLVISSDFNVTNISKTVSIRVKESYIEIVDISKRLLVSGVLKNRNGQVLFNELVRFNLGGVDYSVVTDDFGVFNIQGIPNADLVISFDGCEDTLGCDYSISLGDFLTVDVVVGVSSPYNIVAVDKDAGENDKYLTFYLKDVNGNVLNYKTLSVVLNGKTYNVTTDVNGKVSLAVKFTTAKSYSWKISFAGDEDYNSASKTVKIVVSKKSMKIVPKKISYTFKKAAKTKYVKATLKTSNKYLKTGKKVTLTVNGKKFTVKAGKNGAITFNIASVMKKGTYKVKIKFAGDSTYKSCASKIIKIKIN